MSRSRSGNATAAAAAATSGACIADCEEVQSPTTITIMRSSGETARVRRPMQQEEKAAQE